MLQKVKNVVSAHEFGIATAAAGLGGVALGGVIGAAIVRKSSKRTRKSNRKHNKSKKSNARNKNKTRKIKGRRHSPHTAGKNKDRSHRRIRYTSKGQPYIIQGNGRARFISMRSASSSHKRKGGKY
jgi:Flp pilus assembly protein TadB